MALIFMHRKSTDDIRYCHYSVGIGRGGNNFTLKLSTLVIVLKVSLRFGSIIPVCTACFSSFLIPRVPLGYPGPVENGRS